MISSRCCKSNFMLQNRLIDKYLSSVSLTKIQQDRRDSAPLTKCQGTREIGSLYREFVTTRFCSIHFKRPGWRI